jgi:hypothetical protein
VISYDKKCPLVLVCGPWSSGTSAVAGMLAHAGVFAPGPYMKVNDPMTPETVEMSAFRDLLLELADEPELSRRVDSPAVLAALTQFRDGPLAAAREAAGIGAGEPVLLKHALSALFLPELESVFDVKIVGVLRSMTAIEATRVRRRWLEHLGGAGAKVIFSYLFNHLLKGGAPFHLIRFEDLQADPARTLDTLAHFLSLDLSPERRAAALAFVNR